MYMFATSKVNSLTGQDYRQDEDQNGHDGSYIECYRKEHQGCSVEDAKSHVIKMISNAWKQLNKDCLNPNPFPASFIKASLNAARMAPLMYSYDEKHRLPSLEEHMKSLILKSVPYKKMYTNQTFGFHNVLRFGNVITNGRCEES